MAGVSRQQYATYTRLIRVMCSGRVDFTHVLRAFTKGADGVFIGGCHFNECHYITDGNYSALGMVRITQKILEQIGLNPRRLLIANMSAGEGIRFAEMMNEFNGAINRLGRLGEGEGIEESALQERLQTARALAPYVKLVERERLRIPVKTEEAYEAYFAGEEFKEIFEQTIKEQLIIGQIVASLRKGPLTTVEIAAAAGLSPSEASRYLINTSRQRYVRFDENQKRYALA